MGDFNDLMFLATLGGIEMPGCQIFHHLVGGTSGRKFLKKTIARFLTKVANIILQSVSDR